MSITILGIPSPDAKDQDVGKTYSKSPGYVTAKDGDESFCPRPATAHTPEHKLERR